MADNGGDEEHRIKEGDYVVLKRGDIYKAAQVQPKQKLIFEKQWFYLDSAIGQFYSTTFEIMPGGILQQKKPKHKENTLDAAEAGTDNRNIVDDGKSQKLTRNDIESLKGQGLKSQEIIQQLIDNSSTFRDKTEYAQDKYIKKKKKKYDNNITILKPCCRILAMMYHGREPGKICHLRYDTLGQMLTLANIHAGSKVLVFETCTGLVLGAVMERMGGYGSVIQMYPGGSPVRAGIDNFGFPAHFYDMLYEFPVCQVNALLEGTLSLTDQSSSADGRESICTDEQQGSPPEESMKSDAKEDQERRDIEQRKEAKVQERKIKLQQKQNKLAAAAALLDGRNADGLVIASRFHPSPVLLGLIKFLAPSRPFVVYSQYKEPLVDCYTKLKDQGGTVGLRLTDTWLRHYQVLPSRTHPVLLMSGGGGYLLAGTTVATKSAFTAGTQRSGEPLAKRPKLTEVEG